MESEATPLQSATVRQRTHWSVGLLIALSIPGALKSLTTRVHVLFILFFIFWLCGLFLFII